MSIQLFDTAEVQDFLRLASGLNQPGGNPRTKQIIHRILSDLYKAIEDLNITPDEYWAGVAYLNQLGSRGEAGLLSPGLGFDRYFDMRMDAEDAALGIQNGTPRTIEGPLYVTGAPVEQGFARLDDGSDKDGHTLIMHGTVRGADGQPLPGAQVEVWHANTKGFYSHFDPTGEQQPFNMRRTIIADGQGRYKFQSIVPVGYGCPPDGPTQALLNQLGRHGNRPAHIHFFVSAPGHRKLTTQVNIDGDPLVFDDFAYATREGLVPAVVERTDAARIQAEGLSAPFAEIVFDIQLSALVNGVDNQMVDRPRLAA
ncbi:catechol 1,2-dioxygenase [Comamonas aquatica]|uniref:catechol 1,2-dioxygenase n=1 Tax=Comamonas aquatica TaxID=225991 RepID=UPI00244762B6|nr:catechol 1,2-dioxygenase [Comamonas aquatica]MDH0202563.1 catechol 1,2-dioxygenase [Comamonas aquatica]MDH0373279.1 catechol 1,2-dioxygenase [Comamonas aquatica]MDH0383272.1 catechol 1,2-dioxygenase [Comamonas aquatica]MDH0431278.1 catechol 1,2-dioxygenase [Comamonas aquatica]MDH0496186.1 catechol 1,2-dioxygenase [Comamonas aquatica]